MRCLRTLYIVWSLVRRRESRRLTRLQTMYNVLIYRKISLNVALRLRCGCVYFFNLLKTSTVKQWISTCNPLNLNDKKWQQFADVMIRYRFEQLGPYQTPVTGEPTGVCIFLRIQIAWLNQISIQTVCNKKQNLWTVNSFIIQYWI